MIFPPLCPSTHHPLLPQAIPSPLFMSMDHVYKFCGYSIFYTVLYIPMAILELPICTSFLKKTLFIFIFRERGREGEREEEKHGCVTDTLIGSLWHTPSWGPGPQPRHVP